MNQAANRINRSLGLAVAFALSAGLANTPARANPAGAQVVQGNVRFSNPSADVLNIHNSNGAIIHWQRFDIAPGQTTNFIQPSSTSSVLNRVVGNDPSRLLGNLNSNGRVFLINQNGLLVGEGATIDTAGFFGSTLNLTDEDFLKGRLRFEGGGHGDLVNRGYIRAQGGNIVLIAPNIENGGVIEVVDGEILLAAGKSIELASIDNPSIRYEVRADDNQVVNLGRIIAERGAASLFAGRLRHSGEIRANGLVRNADGSISLVASERVDIDGAVDASGETGGGKVQIHARDIALEAGGHIDASATGKGDGGEVTLYAEHGVSVQGQISARGGEQGGNGGFIETSGLQRLDIGVAPDASAPKGEAGQWLIDPNDLTVQSAQAGASNTNISSGPTYSTTDDSAVITTETIQTALNNGTSVILETTTSGANSQDGNITVLSDIRTNSQSNVSLTLRAHNDIIFDASGSPITIAATGQGALDLVLQADADLDRQGRIQFLTGTGNSFFITINTHGGQLLTNRAMEILGEKGLVLDGDWAIHDKLYIENTASLTLADSTGTPRTLNVGDGGFLYGEGQINGNVTVDGGAIAGGDGQSGFGTLNIANELHFVDGLLYSVIGALSTDWQSSRIDAGSILIDGGQLMLAWEGGFAAQGVIDGPGNNGLSSAVPLNLLSCIGTGCMTVTDQNAFSAPIHPLAITSATVSFDTATDGFLKYGSISTVAGAQFNEFQRTAGSSVTWSGTTGQDWSQGQPPQPSEYVILSPEAVALSIDSTVTLAGLQAGGKLIFQSGGQLTVNGDFITTPSADIRLEGNGSIDGGGQVNIAPGSRWQLQQGSLGLPINSWGLLLMPRIGATTDAQIQLNADLDSHGLIRLSPGRTSNIDGTGSINLFSDLDFNGGGTLALAGDTKLFSAAPGARFSGTGKLSLSGDSILDLSQGPAGFDPSIVIDLLGGTIIDLQNIPFPDLFNWGSGTLTSSTSSSTIVIGAGQTMNLLGSADMRLDGALMLQNNGDMHFQSSGGDLVLPAGSTLENTGLLSLDQSAAAGINGNGTLINTGAGSSGGIQLNSTDPLTLAVEFKNNGALSLGANTRLNIEGEAQLQSGDIAILNGAVLALQNGGNLTLVSSTVSLDINPGTSTASGRILVESGSTLDIAGLGEDFSRIEQIDLNGGQMTHVQGMSLPANLRLANGAGVHGAGNLDIAATTQLSVDSGGFYGQDAGNRLRIRNDGVVTVASDLTLHFVDWENLNDGELTGNGQLILDAASLTAGPVGNGNSSLSLDSLQLLNGAELVANGLDYAGSVDWQDATLSGTGLTTSGQVTVRTARVNANWTNAAGGRLLWDYRSGAQFELSGATLTNRGEFVLLEAAPNLSAAQLAVTGDAASRLVNEGLLLIDSGDSAALLSLTFDLNGGGIGIASGALKIDADGNGRGDTLALDRASEFLQGFGSFDGSVNNQAGWVSPGRNDAAANVYRTGRLNINGDYRQGPNGRLIMDLDSTASGLQADQLVVGGDLRAGGRLDFNIINNKSVLEIAALIDQRFRPFDIGGRFIGGFDVVDIPRGLNFKLGPGGVITITSDNPYLNRIAGDLQGLIDSGGPRFGDVHDALLPPADRVRRILGRARADKDEKKRRGGPRLVCR